MKTLLSDAADNRRQTEQGSCPERPSRSAADGRSPAASRSRARRTSRPRRWSPRCWARRRACCATSPTSATCRSSGRSSRCTASRVEDGDEDGSLHLRPERRRVGALRGDRRARRGIPHPDPVLRPAAAPARRGAHPRPRRMPHRRPADQLPHGRAARVRRDRRQELRGHPHHGARTACTARTSSCRTRASARPSRCC